MQGVGFRYTTQVEATALGLGGWVRNRSDGSVEVVAEGERQVVEQFLSFLHRGPRGAHVIGVSIEWLPASGSPIPFELRTTA